MHTADEINSIKSIKFGSLMLWQPNRKSDLLYAATLLEASLSQSPSLIIFILHCLQETFCYSHLFTSCRNVPTASPVPDQVNL